MKAWLLATIFIAPLNAEDEHFWQNLWDGKAPGAEPLPLGSEVIEEGLRISEVEQPQYLLLRPEKPNGQGIVILAGGGYSKVSLQKEGIDVGDWLNERGITALVLKYRVSRSDEAGYHYPVPLLDARQGIRLLRKQSTELEINPNRIGVIGFSAGGHLAGMTAILADEEELEISATPNFAALIYPVISMRDDWAHQGSRKRLLGPKPPEGLADQLSLHLHVNEKTPPLFLVHSADDAVVPLRNSAELMAACAENKVPVRAAIYPTGGHGFGPKGRGAAKDWLQELEKWLLTLP